MVTFNKDNITITLQGDKDTYVQTLKALNNAASDLSERGTDYAYLLHNLINDMLPDFKQLVNVDESMQLNRMKEQNRETADMLVNDTDKKV